MNIEPSSPISRRTWIKSSIIGLGLPLTVGSSTLAQFDESVLKIGIVTDAHYADKGTLGSRHYRDSVLKMNAVVDIFNQQNRVFAVFIAIRAF